jgi:hypothetical protein
MAHSYLADWHLRDNDTHAIGEQKTDGIATRQNLFKVKLPLAPLDCGELTRLEGCLDTFNRHFL